MSETTETLPEMFPCWQSVDPATRRRIAAMAWHTEPSDTGGRLCVDATGCRCPWSIVLDADHVVGAGTVADRQLGIDAAIPDGMLARWQRTTARVAAFMDWADTYGAPGPGAPDPGIVPIPPAVMAAALGVG